MQGSRLFGDSNCQSPEKVPHSVYKRATVYYLGTMNWYQELTLRCIIKGKFSCNQTTSGSGITSLHVIKELPEGGNPIDHHLPRWRRRVIVRSKEQRIEYLI